MAPCSAEVMEANFVEGFSHKATEQMDQLSEPSPTSQSSTMSADSTTENHSAPTFLRHQVTKLDTLPGLAIKYGVTVSDIKRVNSLISDSAMFARGTLLIPKKQLPVDEDMAVWLGMIVSGYGKAAGVSPGTKPSKDHLQMMGFGQPGSSKALNALNDFYGINETGDALQEARQQAETEAHLRSAARNGGVEVELMDLSGTEGFAGGRDGPKLDERLVRRRGPSEDQAAEVGPGTNVGEGPGGSMAPQQHPEPWASPFAAFRGGSLSGAQGAPAPPRKDSILDKLRRVASQPALPPGGGRSRFTAAAEALVSGGRGAASGPIAPASALSNTGSRGSLPPKPAKKAD